MHFSITSTPPTLQLPTLSTDVSLCQCNCGIVRIYSDLSGFVCAEAQQGQGRCRPQDYLTFPMRGGSTALCITSALAAPSSSAFSVDQHFTMLMARMDVTGDSRNRFVCVLRQNSSGAFSGWDIITLMSCGRSHVQMWTRSDPGRTRKSCYNGQSCEGGGLTDFLKCASSVLWLMHGSMSVVLLWVHDLYNACHLPRCRAVCNNCLSGTDSLLECVDLGCRLHGVISSWRLLEHLRRDSIYLGALFLTRTFRMGHPLHNITDGFGRDAAGWERVARRAT